MNDDEAAADDTAEQQQQQQQQVQQPEDAAASDVVVASDSDAHLRLFYNLCCFDVMNSDNYNKTVLSFLRRLST